MYPHGDLFSGISGYQSFVVGNTGVEASYDRVLTGRDRQFDFGQIVSGKDNIGNVILSQTVAAQQTARDALEGQKGSVVALDVRTGEVLAMYSNPSFDPNPLAGHDTEKVNLVVLPAQRRPGEARAATRVPRAVPTRVDVQGRDRGRRDHDRQGAAGSHLSARGDVPASRARPPGSATSAGSTCGGGSLTQSFIQSCNATFARLGYEMGNDFVPVMNECGVGSDVAPIAPPLDLDPGAVGSIGPAAGAEAPRFALAGIGQGDVFTTPLEMALVAAGVANGGVIMEPHVAKQITNADGKVIQTIEAKPWKTCMDPPTASAVTAMMVENVERGTATRRTDRQRGRRGEDGYRADRRRRPGTTRVVRRLCTRRQPAVRGRCAGKSTLVKTVSGVNLADSGEFRFLGEPAHIKSPQDATNLGIATVYQDLALADNLDVAGNLFLGHEEYNPGPLRWLWAIDDIAMEKESGELIRSLSARIPSVTTPVASLSGGQRQIVAIARALLGDPKLVLLDEPTAALGVAQTRQVLDFIHALKRRGLAVVVISHNLPDVFEVADRIVVLFLGRNAGDFVRKETTREEVVGAITGGLGVAGPPPEGDAEPAEAAP